MTNVLLHILSIAQGQLPQSDQLQSPQSKQTEEQKLKARLRCLVDAYGDETIELANRNKINTVKELADTLIQQMDMIYHHIIQGIQFDDTNIQWIKAKKYIFKSNRYNLFIKIFYVIPLYVYVNPC